MVDIPKNPTQPNHIYLIYLYKEDLVLNNLQLLICHETQPNQILYFNIYVNPTQPNHIYLYIEDLALNNLQWLLCHKTQPNQIIYI